MFQTVMHMKGGECVIKAREKKT